MMSESMAEPWVSVEEVVRHLGVANHSIYGRSEKIRLPPNEMGCLRGFTVAEVEQWSRQGNALAARPKSKEQD